MTSVFKPSLLAGQTAIVTGGGSGLGASIAQRIAGHGASVAIIGRSMDKAQAMANQLVEAGGKATAHAADVRDYDAVAGIAREVAERNGGIDIVVAGAAGNFVSRASDMSSNGFKAVMDIDLLGSFNTFRAVLPHLSGAPGGRLLAISAVQSLNPMAMQSHVCAAKAGLNMLVQSLAIELGPMGIRCNVMAPGPVEETEGMRRLAPEGNKSWATLLRAIPLRRAATLDEIADLALFLVSDAARYISGAVIPIDGALSNVGSLGFGDMLLESASRNSD